MASRLLGTATRTMYAIGVILAPVVSADALTDFADLRYIISTASSQIGAPTNSSRNWGGLGLLWPGSSGQMGTADLVSNITTSVLRLNYNLGMDTVRWITIDPGSPAGGNLTAPINLNETGGIDGPYIDYVMAIPNLSAALVALGRSWHHELNTPVYSSIGSLQQTMNQFSSALLEAGLLHTFTSTLRTNRAVGTLEDAQTAWSRILNLPGPSPSTPTASASPPPASPPASSAPPAPVPSAVPSPVVPSVVPSAVPTDIPAIAPSVAPSAAPSSNPGGFFRLPGISPRRALRRHHGKDIVDGDEPPASPPAETPTSPSVEQPESAPIEQPTSSPVEPPATPPVERPAFPPDAPSDAPSDAPLTVIEITYEEGQQEVAKRDGRGGFYSHPPAPAAAYFSHKQLWGRAAAEEAQTVEEKVKTISFHG